MAHQYKGFLQKGITKQGYPFLVGGLGENPPQLELEKIIALEFRAHHDAYDVDYLLANAVIDSAKAGHLILGASIAVSGMIMRTGGIIGSPNSEITSADNEVEEIVPGLFLITFPGGPGAAVQCTACIAAKIADFLRDCNKNNMRTDAICDIIETHANTYMLVQDGSGEDARGVIVILSNIKHCGSLKKSNPFTRVTN